MYVYILKTFLISSVCLFIKKAYFSFLVDKLASLCRKTLCLGTMNLNSLTSSSKQHSREYKHHCHSVDTETNIICVTPLKCKVVKRDTTLSSPWPPPLRISHVGFIIPFLSCHFPSLSLFLLKYFLSLKTQPIVFSSVVLPWHPRRK